MISILPCLLIVAGFFLGAITIPLLHVLTLPKTVITSVDWVYGAIYLLIGATWTATAWAIWANRPRAFVAAIFADVVVFAPVFVLEAAERHAARSTSRAIVAARVQG